MLSRAPTYGYEITEQLAQYGFGPIAKGTIYPPLLTVHFLLAPALALLLLAVYKLLDAKLD